MMLRWPGNPIFWRITGYLGTHYNRSLPWKTDLVIYWTVSPWFFSFFFFNIKNGTIVLPSLYRGIFDTVYLYSFLFFNNRPERDRKELSIYLLPISYCFPGYLVVCSLHNCFFKGKRLRKKTGCHWTYSPVWPWRETLLLIPHVANG